MLKSDSVEPEKTLGVAHFVVVMIISGLRVTPFDGH